MKPPGLPIAYLLFLLVIGGATRGKGEPPSGVQPSPVPHVNLSEILTKVTNPGGLALFKGRYYVTDQRANQVIVFDEGGRVVQTFGSVGSGKGEFLSPTTLGVGPDGTVFIRDLGNDRIEFFDHNGHYAGEIKAPDFTGFAVSPRGEILIGRPENGALVTVYDRNGREVRKIGRLRKTSELYGSSLDVDDLRNRILINRVSIAFGDHGALYIAFLFAPIVQKYDVQGKLLWERRLAGPDIDRLTSLFLSDEGRTGRKFVRIAMDGRAANLVIAACGFDAEVGRLYVLLPNLRLMALDLEGRSIGLFLLQTSSKKSPSPLEIGSASRNVLSFVDPFTQVIWQGSVTP